MRRYAQVQWIHGYSLTMNSSVFINTRLAATQAAASAGLAPVVTGISACAAFGFVSKYVSCESRYLAIRSRSVAFGSRARQAGNA